MHLQKPMHRVDDRGILEDRVVVGLSTDPLVMIGVNLPEVAYFIILQASCLFGFHVKHRTNSFIIL